MPRSLIRGTIGLGEETAKRRVDSYPRDGRAHRTGGPNFQGVGSMAREHMARCGSFAGIGRASYFGQCGELLGHLFARPSRLWLRFSWSNFCRNFFPNLLKGVACGGSSHRCLGLVAACLLLCVDRLDGG